MNSGRKTRRKMIAWCAFFFLCALIAAGSVLLDRFLHGDSSAPCRVVPVEWKAHLSPAGEKCQVRIECSAAVLKTENNLMSVVPLFPDGAVFRGVTMNGKDVIPVRKDGWYCVEIKRPGNYTMLADIDVMPVKNESGYSYRFRKPLFVKSEIHVDSDEALEVSLDGNAGMITGEPGIGTHGILYAGLRGDVTVQWGIPRPKAVREGTVNITPSTVWTVKDKLLSAETLLETTVSGGSRKSIKIILPAGSDRVDVGRQIVGDVRLNGRELTLFFPDKVAGEFSIRLGYEIPLPSAETAECPSLSSDDGRIAEGGYLMVINNTSGVLLENSHSGLEAVSDLDVPAAVMGFVPGRPLFLYRIVRRDAAPVFDVVTKELFPMMDTIADRADSLTVIQEGGEEITRIVYSIRNNGKQFLRVEMPGNSRLMSVIVDNKSRIAAQKDGVVLIPLEDSIRTLGGLIPFPVELIYCRQGERIESGKSVQIGLPELPDVPVAVVNADICHPESLEMESWRGNLAIADARTRPPPLYFLQTHTASDSPGDLLERINDAWAFNAYNIGYDAYRRNRLEEAEYFLSKAPAIASGASQVAGVSGFLMDNIKAARGEIAGRDKLEKAKISAIQGSLAGMNEQIQAQQSQLISAGLANIRDGNDEVGAELLKEAERLGEQVSRRGGSGLRQKSVSRMYRDELGVVEDERRRKEQLESRLATLQTEAQSIVSEAGEDEEKREQAKKLGQGLLIAAREEDIASEDMSLSGIAWGGRQTAAREVSAGAQAQTLKNRILDSGNAAPEFSMQKQKGKRLSEINAELDKKVSLLDRALSLAKSDKSESAAPLDYSYAHRSISGKKDAVRTLRSSLGKEKSRSAPTLNDYAEAKSELDDLKQQVASSKVSFGDLDDSLRREIEVIEQEILDVEERISSGTETMNQSSTVAVSVTNLIDASSANAVKQLETFLAANYAGASGDHSDFYFEGGVLHVQNTADRPEQIAAVIENLKENMGAAVQVAGRTFKMNAGALPVISSWFTNTSGAGNRYAILDEAQLRTLVFVENDNNGPRKSGWTVRDTVVGTSNAVNGKTVRLTRADLEGNSINIDDSEVFVEHGKYLAVAGPDEISVIMTGQVHEWQEEVEKPELDAEIPFRINFAGAGRRISFTKTLLSAGESPDIELKFKK